MPSKHIDKSKSSGDQHFLHWSISEATARARDTLVNSYRRSDADALQRSANCLRDPRPSSFTAIHLNHRAEPSWPSEIQWHPKAAWMDRSTSSPGINGMETIVSDGRLLRILGLADPTGGYFMEDESSRIWWG